MTFRDWQQLSPADAAKELRTRARQRLSPAQQRAVIATLGTEDELQRRFASAKRDTPLGGVPYFTKDLFDVAKLPTLAGSTFLPEVRPTPSQDGTFTRHLTEAGAVLVGKTHMHEFAYGITGENPHYGDCEHPHFPGRTTGGSSSGSAAAVAAGIVPFATASDTGGSARLPAAFCGLFGYRGVPRDPWISDAFPLAPSFDSAGWFTGSAGDMRTVLASLTGLRTSERAPRGCYFELPGLDAEVASAFRTAGARLASAADAATGKDLLMGFAHASDTYNTTAIVEAWNVHRGWAERYRERYDPAVWQRLIRIRSLTPDQIATAEARTVALRLLWTSFFLTFDFLVLPASPAAAFTKAECTAENRGRILALTAPASIGGLPVLTLPVKLPSGLTTGLQVIVNHPQSPVLNWALNAWNS
ncbi:MAG TPA: amidase [Opitutaceae bacterium]|nr:amidase [Opitutaceae bacterium]